jgi:hypothetical protein
VTMKAQPKRSIWCPDHAEQDAQDEHEEDGGRSPKLPEIIVAVTTLDRPPIAPTDRSSPP